MRKILLFTFIVFAINRMNAQTGPFWAEDVAPIIYANCTKCHNPNGIAPFSLMTYSDAANEASNIQQAVTGRTMPPWPPDTSYTRFVHERTLTQTEIQTIDDWVNNGMQQGNMANAPVPPVYTGAAEIASPDMIAQMPVYTVNAATDLYRCFVVPSGLAQDEYITQVEVLPGNRNIVHHVLVYQDATNTCINLDNADPGPGYTSFGGVGSNTAELVAGWVPGQGMYQLPANMGIKLDAGTNIIMQIHYPGGTFAQVDSTQVRFTFASGTVRQVALAPVINHWSNMTNGPLFIPADSVKTFHAQELVALDATLISVAPHMHLLGREISSFAIDPSGDTIPLISIPDWNFHWQGFYNYRQPVHVPLYSTIHAYGTYDNTASNPWNPSSPPQNVAAGEATTDEMFVIYYAYLNYQAGDENIIVDSTLLASMPDSFPSAVQTPQLYNPFPVPSNGTDLNVQYFMPVAAGVVVEIVDVNGKVVKAQSVTRANAGFNQLTFSVGDLASGSYFVRMTSGVTVRSKAIQL